MANQQAPFGFRLTRRYGGAVPNYAVESPQIAYNNANSIYQGDPVKLLTTGYIDLAGVTDSPLYGIFDGVEYFDTVQRRKVWRNAWLAPGTALANSVIAKVYTDPLNIYEVQSNGAVIPQSAIGANANYISGGTPNALLGISTAALDPTTINTTNTLQFRILGLSQNGTNDNTSSYNIVEVLLNGQAALQTTGV